jgi:hypothetical protein
MPDTPAASKAASDTVELVVLTCGRDTIRCRRLADRKPVTLKARGGALLVPGHVAMVRVQSERQLATRVSLSGEVVGVRAGVDAFDLPPWQPVEFDLWDPREDEGDDGLDGLEQPLRARLLARGPRMMFEMIQIVPGLGEGLDPYDPIVEAVELKQRGDVAGAWLFLMKLLARDIRCIDARVHLGNLLFDDERTLPTACAHYEVAVRFGQHQLGEGFDGMLPWALIDNRPFLRAMHGFGLALWRLGAFTAALEVFERLLWLGPWDNLGVRMIVPVVRAREPWRDDDEPPPRSRASRRRR